MQNNRATLANIYQKHKNLLMYGIIGLTGASLDLIVFSVLTGYCKVYYQYANIISVSIGICNNFVLNTFFNFKVFDKLCIRFLKFYSIGIFGLVLNSLLLYSFVELLHVSKLVSKLFVTFAVPVVQYVLNKKFTFQKRGSENGQAVHRNAGLQ